MFRRFTCVSGLLGSAGHQRLLRNVGALVVKTRNITEMITEEFQREWDTAKPYEDMPGPKPLPVIGNFWRFLPYIGKLQRGILHCRNSILIEYLNRIRDLAEKLIVVRLTGELFQAFYGNKKFDYHVHKRPQRFLQQNAILHLRSVLILSYLGLRFLTGR